MAVGYVKGGVTLGGSSTVGFTHAGGQVDSDIVVEWDLDNDGDFSESVEDITSFVLAAETLTGRDFPSSLTGKAGPGQLKLTLLNDDDRFSFFNAASPLNAAPFSLKTGRKLRVRTSDAVANDPVLLARDRFGRSDGPLGVTETGQVWTAQVGTFSVRGRVAAAGTPFATRLFSTIDVTVDDYYVQATIRQVEPQGSRLVGLVVRWTDTNNYTLVRYDTEYATPLLMILDRDGGVDTTLDTYPVQAWEGMTIGAGVVGDAVTAYIGGVPVASGTATSPQASEVGLHASYSDFEGRSPELGDFHVWDHVAAEVDGILWTGDLTDVRAGVTVGDIKTAVVTGEGVLARAAGPTALVASPRLPIAGAPTGLIVGDVLARAALLHPPAQIAEGTVTTGPVGIDDAEALTLARQVEETERGFLFETQEGHIAYDDAAARAGATSQAWFSDTPGVGQYPFSEIVPADEKARVVNRVTAGVAADAPSGITVTEPNGSGHVDITIPTVATGDFLILFVANSEDGAHEWRVPIFWAVHRDLKTALGMRVYSHFCDGTESGTTVRFYTNNGVEAGLWAAALFRVQNWYESYNSGVAVGDPTSGGNPAAMVHGWGRAPTLFVAVRSGIGSTSPGISFGADFDPPDGYSHSDGLFITSGVFQYDAGIAYAWKIDSVDSEDPTEFFGLDNQTIDESILFAVRGYNGPHTKATLQDPRTTGGDGRFVTHDDVGSQDDHNAVRSNPSVPVLFATETDAAVYADQVLDEFADDRPIITLSFWPSKNAPLRNQAVARRVGDKITVTASGNAGLGIDGDFFIESIGNAWSNGIKLWGTTWELSPA